MDPKDFYREPWQPTFYTCATCHALVDMKEREWHTNWHRKIDALLGLTQKSLLDKH